MSKKNADDILEIEANVENKSFQSHLIRIVSIPIVLIFLLLAFFHFQTKYSNSVDEELRLFESVLYNSLLLDKNVSDMAMSVRGYVIAGNKDFLLPYREGKSRIEGIEESIFFLINGHYDLTRNFRVVTEELEKWNQKAKKMIEARSQNPERAPIEVKVEAQSTEEILPISYEKITHLRELMDIFNQRVVEKKKGARKKLTSVIQITFILEIIFTVLFALFIIYLMTKQIKKLTLSYRNLLQQRLDSMRAFEQASRSKDLFLANMSHEIRTPLGAIIGFAELVSEKSELESETRSHISFIKRNSEHLLGLIDDLFDLSRVSADKLDISLEDVDLKFLIQDLVNTFSSKILDKKIDFNLRFDTKIPNTILTDQVRLTQILSNLIGNAIKFSPDKARLDVIFSFKDNILVVDVIDQGIGIAPEMQSTIFDSFSQADVKHSRKFGGAGLGLSISRKLAEILNGELDLLDSTLNIGSHFQLRLPLEEFGNEFFDQQGWDSRDQFSEDEELPKPKKVIDLSGANILLVEDSRENQILFKIFIESSHANLTIVDNGTDAVRKAMNNDFDIIIMDIQMPGIDGYEALRILRSSSYNKKIIALTAHTMKGEKERCLAAGFDGYLSKPVSQNKLLSTIKRSINS